VIHSRKEREKAFSEFLSRTNRHVLQFKVKGLGDECCFQEELQNGKTLRIRILTMSYPTPPPMETLHLDLYAAVQILEIACPIEIPWVFLLSSKLASLQSVRFQPNVFKNYFFQSDYSNVSNSSSPVIVASPHVQHMEIILSRKHIKGFTPDQLKLVVDSIQNIFDLSELYYTDLVKVEFRVPIGVKLEQLLWRIPKLQVNGGKQVSYDHGYIYYCTGAEPVNTTPKRSLVSVLYFMCPLIYT